MADYEYTNTTSPEPHFSGDASYTLALSENDRQLLQMALGELLQTVGREEHLIPQIQDLLARINATTPNA